MVIQIADSSTTALTEGNIDYFNRDAFHSLLQNSTSRVKDLDEPPYAIQLDASGRFEPVEHFDVGGLHRT